jgi:hypothetical protein
VASTRIFDLGPLATEEGGVDFEELERIHATTQELKDSHQALGADMILSVMELMPNALLSLGAQAASRAMNSIVTNVPAPQLPLYALISCNGRVCWGFNADLGLVPDLAEFVALIRKAVERLAEVAEVKLTPPDARVRA